VTPGSGINLVSSARPETELILCCARTRVEARIAERIRKLVQGGLDWELLLRTAAPQGVTGLLHRALGATRPEGVPEPVLRDLSERLQANARRNLLLARELPRLLALFEAGGIRAIPFKGPLLTVAAYEGNLALRHFYDLDVLVHPVDVPAAKEVLRSQRYQLSWSGGWEYHFVEEGGKWLVDLHERIAPEYFPDTAPFDEVWDRLRPVSLLGRPVSTLAPEDLLLVLSVQLAKDCRVWRQRLVQICDAAELVRSHPELDWDFVLRRARAIGGLRILLLDLKLASALLGAALPERVLRAAREEPVVGALAAEVRARLFPEAEGPVAALRYRAGGILREDSWFHFRVRERLRDKLQYPFQFIRNHTLLLITPTERDRRFFALPRPLGFLYYLVRPVRVLAQWARTGRLRGEVSARRRDDDLRSGKPIER